MFKAFLKAFARREEVAVVLAELRALRAEVHRTGRPASTFEQVDRASNRSTSASSGWRGKWTLVSNTCNGR